MIHLATKAGYGHSPGMSVLSGGIVHTSAMARSALGPTCIFQPALPMGVAASSPCQVDAQVAAVLSGLESLNRAALANVGMIGAHTGWPG